MRNALSIDVEEYFQVGAFESVLDRADWDSHESRVEWSTDRILALLAERKVRATFFVLGWIAEGVLVRGSAWFLAGITGLSGEAARRWQSGNLRSYSAWLAAGAAAFLVFAAFYALGANGSNIHLNWMGH